MRVILAGQRSFGAAVFRMLIAEGHDVAAVRSPGELGESSHQDPLTRDAWRAQKWVAAPLHPAAVADLAADLFVCAHSHDFIGRQSRAATRLGGIGYHPSLLPRHRGRDAVEWTVRMGDPVAGGSVYWLTDNVDGGPLAAQEHVLVKPSDTVSTLWRGALFPLGVELLRRVLHELDMGYINEVPQDEHCATWEPSIDRPPLFRPELPQLGDVPGFKTVRGLA